jgi:predicted transcriptional regulator
MPPQTTKSSASLALPLAASPAATARLDPGLVLAACADPVRWRILQELHGGAPVSVQEMATRLRRTADSIAKQFRVLREAGVVALVPSPDGDGRKQCHEVPAAFRTRDAAGRAALDFGTVVLRIGG